MSRSLLDHPGLPHIERLLAGGSPSPGASDLLASLGVSDPGRAVRNLQSLALHPAFPREDTAFLARFLEALGETFEPERALANIERILETRKNPDALLAALHRSRERLSILLTLSSGSQFLSDTLLRHPEHLDWLLRPSTLGEERPKEKMWSELWRWVRREKDEPGGPARALRRFRQREYLRVGLRDLMRRADMVQTTRALSDLADVCLEAALRIARAECEAIYGKPKRKRRYGRWNACAFSVIALGKLGGRELNFSSDIDLLFLYSSDEGGTTGAPEPRTGQRERRISNHDFHTRLSRRLIALMTENTEEGHVFRVDTRLRPEGEQGALAYSLRSCEVYYESWGETWERQALIKARPAAGSAELGQAFLDMIRPFIYRRTLDISALDEIGRIKDRIDRQLSSRGRGALNVKLGEGGIREIEFIAQSFQLIYGGKEPLLQTPSTLEALSAIQTLGLLPIETCSDLAAAYTFLRDVEHRIQVTHGLQTHDLPADPHGLTVLARKMDFSRGADLDERGAFEEALRRHQDRVAACFDNLFRSRSPGRPSAEARPAAETQEAGGHPVSAETHEDSLSPEDLALYNFSDPRAASAQLRLLRNGEPFAHISARAKRTFDNLLPGLLHLSLDLPDPDRAVSNLGRFVERSGGREAVFSLLVRNEQIFKSLLRLFGSSDYLTEILLSQPGLLDTLLLTDALTVSKAPETLAAEMAEAAGAPSSADARFAAIGAAKRAEELVIGMRSILGEADIIETLTDLTRLAECTVAAALRIAESEVRPLYGTPLESGGGGEAGLAVIAMGKLGGREMTFGSDLDLIFAYSG
ncbi:MAG: bifunctional [glutamate--ammonia ligase]-adenylyl-L-tyrosine phosphorylase/[glutamate--ammonia-ligase] adenylyltransferase, partial [bacterium]